MRMPLDHLVGDAIRHMVEVEPALLGTHLRVVDHLQQQVAELARQVRPVFAPDRVRDLVGLLDRVGRDRGKGLLDVPGTAPLGIAQPPHHGQQPIDAALARTHSRLPCSAPLRRPLPRLLSARRTESSPSANTIPSSVSAPTAANRGMT